MRNINVSNSTTRIRKPQCDNDNEKTTFELVRGFFCFCHTFDFAKNVICPYLGRPVERADFDKRTVADMGEYLKLTDEEGGVSC
jgi:hypothetical protein